MISASVMKELSLSFGTEAVVLSVIGKFVYFNWSFAVCNVAVSLGVKSTRLS